MTDASLDFHSSIVRRPTPNQDQEALLPGEHILIRYTSIKKIIIIKRNNNLSITEN